MTDEIKKTRSVEGSSNVVNMCSICLDPVSDHLVRSTAYLHCGHLFHLDCIGSAFNIKGAMQCPNCRKVERGRWLYASGSTTRHALPEMMNMDDYTFHEDHYHGISYPEIPFNIHWCPFSGLARVHSAFEGLESSPPPPLPPPYHNLHRHQNMFPLNMSASSTTNETIEDPNISYHWNGVSNNPHGFPSTGNMHYHNDQGSVAPVSLRSTRGSYMHPFLFGHGSRLHERLQPSHTIHRHHHHQHQPSNSLGMPTAIIPTMTRFHGRRALPPLPVPTHSVSNRNGGFFVVPPRDFSLQSSHETPASSVYDGGIFVVPPRGSAVQNSHEPAATSVSDRNGAFFVIQSRGSSTQSSNEAENSLPVVSSDSHRTGNFWNGHLS